ncbi:MAG: hypothetical protein NTW67_02605 [Candidatus Woesearchaeota archaeon]|nr:hypothetical protein [Candidatus Woesearchaeota archaeon]
MGENAILELRTVNLKKDLEKRSAERSSNSFHCLLTALVRMDKALEKMLESAGFTKAPRTMIPYGISETFSHGDGSRITHVLTGYEDAKEWLSDKYVGYGNPATVTPALQSLEGVYSEASLSVELVPAQPEPARTV